jgi:hypothetical protein
MTKRGKRISVAESLPVTRENQRNLKERERPAYYYNTESVV